MTFSGLIQSCQQFVGKYSNNGAELDQSSIWAAESQNYFGCIFCTVLYYRSDYDSEAEIKIFLYLSTCFIWLKKKLL